MKKRLISVFAFALAVSAGAAFVLYQLISSRVTAGAAAAGTGHPATKSVFVAAHDLEAGVLVTEKDIAKQDVVNIPAGAITKKEDIINRGVINPIHRDTPFFDGTLAGAGEGAGFASIIPKGMRALAIHVNDVVGVAGFAIAGMHVDVLIAGMPPGAGHDNTGQMSRTLLQNITVLSAGQNYQKDAEGKPVLVAVVNLLVTPEQAEIMTLAMDERIQLVLRNPADHDLTETPGAATSNLFSANAGGGHGSRPALPVGGPASVYSPAKSVQRGADGGSAKATAMLAPAPPPRAPSIEVLSGNSRTEIVMGNQVTRVPPVSRSDAGAPTTTSQAVNGWPVEGQEPPVKGAPEVVK